MTVAKYLDPADGQWKPLPVPPHVHPGGSTRIPGEIVAYGGSTPPPGWLVCDGSAFSAATYPLLAAVLPGGKLPDLRGRFPAGVGTGIGLLATGGSASHGHAGNPLPTHDHDAGPLAAHTHTTPAVATTSDAHKHGVNIPAFASQAGGSHGHSITAGGSHTHDLDTATQAVNPGVATIRHVTALDTRSGGSHTHPVGSGGSHTHSVNPPSAASSEDAHAHTVAAGRTGAMSAGTPRVGSTSAGTPSVKDTSTLPPWTGVNFIIFGG